MQSSPLKLLPYASTPSVVAGMLRLSFSTSVDWHYYPYEGVHGGDGPRRTRDILGAAWSGPRCGRTAASCSTMWGQPEFFVLGRI
jgi:hypothetical protein